jgi:hypothetical protein
MGVDDFWPVLFPNFKKKTPIKLSALKGRSVGFDLSVWLHHFCVIDEVVKCLSCSPQYWPPELTMKHTPAVELLLVVPVTRAML